MSHKIVISCHNCRSKLAVPVTSAGKKIRCPKCSEVLLVCNAEEDVADTGSADNFSDWDSEEEFDEVSLPAWAQDDAWNSGQQVSSAMQNPVAEERAERASRPRQPTAAAQVRSASLSAKSATARPDDGTGGVNKLVVAICVLVVLAAIGGGAFVVYLNESHRAQRRAMSLLAEAKARIDEKQPDKAAGLLREYMVAWRASELEEAGGLLQQITLATSDSEVLAQLVAMSDVEFESTRESTNIEDARITHPALVELRSEAVRRNLPKARQQRAIAWRDAREADATAAREQRLQTAGRVSQRRKDDKRKLESGVSKDDEELIAKRWFEDFAIAVPHLFTERAERYSIELTQSLTSNAETQERATDVAEADASDNAADDASAQSELCTRVHVVRAGEVTFNARATPRELSITSPFVADIAVPMAVELVLEDPTTGRTRNVRRHMTASATYVWQTRKWVRKDYESGNRLLLSLSLSVFPEAIDENMDGA